MDTTILNGDKGIQKWGLVGTLLWGLLIALVFVGVQILSMGVYIVLNFRDVAVTEYPKLIKELQYNGTVLSICIVTSFFVCSGMILGIIKIKKGSSIEDYLGFKNVSIEVIKKWFFILIAFIFMSDSLCMLLSRPVVPKFMSSAYSSTEHLWFFWIAFIIAAPIVEELFFRGFLFSGLKSSILGPVGAILVSSFLWTVIHQQYDMFFLTMIFILGLGLGIAKLKSGSVLLTIGLHSFANLVATIEMIVFIS